MTKKMKLIHARLSSTFEKKRDRQIIAGTLFHLEINVLCSFIMHSKALEKNNTGIILMAIYKQRKSRDLAKYFCFS